MTSSYLWEKLVELAEYKKLSIAEIARRSDTPRQTIYNLKNESSKNPSFFLMERIADVLNVSLDEFREAKHHDRHEI